jgi:hypothetical protein
MAGFAFSMCCMFNIHLFFLHLPKDCVLLLLPRVNYPKASWSELGPYLQVRIHICCTIIEKPMDPWRLGIHCILCSFAFLWSYKYSCGYTTKAKVSPWNRHNNTYDAFDLQCLQKRRQIYWFCLFCVCYILSYLL